MHVLVVDDDALTRRMLIRLLAREFGATTVEAENGRAALELLARAPFDLALIDLEMPVLDGAALLTAIRESEALRTLPVIVLSNVRDVDRVRRVLAAGVSDYVAKPIRLDTTGARLARYFREHGHAGPAADQRDSAPSPSRAATTPGALDDAIRACERGIAGAVEQAFGLLVGIDLTVAKADALDIAEPALISGARIDAAAGGSLTLAMRLSAPAASQLAALAGGAAAEAAHVVLWDLTSMVADRAAQLLAAQGQPAAAGAVTVGVGGGVPAARAAARCLRFTTSDGAAAVECVLDH